MKALKTLLVLTVVSLIGLSSQGADLFSQGNKILKKGKKTPKLGLVEIDRKTGKGRLLSATSLTGQKVRALSKAPAKEKERFLDSALTKLDQVRNVVAKDFNAKNLINSDLDRSTKAWYGYYWGWCSPVYWGWTYYYVSYVYVWVWYY